MLTNILKIVLFIGLLPSFQTQYLLDQEDCNPQDQLPDYGQGHGGAALGVVHLVQLGQALLPLSGKLTANFRARYTYGNIVKKKGIINMHLNIRSLANKVSELKVLVKEHSPHIFGISECEIRKVGGKFNEEKLKIPGYTRVVVYVKKSLDYQQIHDLEDDLVQSIWLKGGYKTGKKMYYCHAYREHTSTLGAGIRNQKLLPVSVGRSCCP